MQNFVAVPSSSTLHDSNEFSHQDVTYLRLEFSLIDAERHMLLRYPQISLQVDWLGKSCRMSKELILCLHNHFDRLRHSFMAIGDRDGLLVILIRETMGNEAIDRIQAALHKL